MAKPAGQQSEESRLMKLEQEIEKIKERNSRVESDKAWEISFARRAIITTGTYFISAAFLFSINAQNPLLAAFVPALGFLLSTLTLPLFKKWWLGGRNSSFLADSHSKHEEL